MSYTDLVATGDRLLVSVPNRLNPMGQDRVLTVYCVIDRNQAQHLGFGHQIHRINRRSNGRVYIGRNPVVARV